MTKSFGPGAVGLKVLIMTVTSVPGSMVGWRAIGRSGV